MTKQERELIIYEACEMFELADVSMSCLALEYAQEVPDDFGYAKLTREYKKFYWGWNEPCVWYKSWMTHARILALLLFHEAYDDCRDLLTKEKEK